jgi:hypothetical protein
MKENEIALKKVVKADGNRMMLTKDLKSEMGALEQVKEKKGKLTPNEKEI